MRVLSSRYLLYFWMRKHLLRLGFHFKNLVLIKVYRIKSVKLIDQCLKLPRPAGTRTYSLKSP
jgi:hypothetical protein